MLFYKTISDCITQSRKEYNRLIKRRKERLLEFIRYDVPKFIIVNEIELLREPFYKFLVKRLMNKLYSRKILL